MMGEHACVCVCVSVCVYVKLTFYFLPYSQPESYLSIFKV